MKKKLNTISLTGMESWLTNDSKKLIKNTLSQERKCCAFVIQGTGKKIQLIKAKM